MKYNFRKIMLELIILIFACVMAFAFLSFVNWSIDFKEWNGFSRFLMAGIGVVVLLKTGDTLKLF